MRSRTLATGVSTVISLWAVVGCTRPNPAYDAGFEEVPDPLEEVDVDASGSDDGEPPSDDPSDPSTGGPEPLGGDDSNDDGADDGPDSGDAPPEDDDDPRLLYSSLDDLQTVVEPEVGAGEGLLSEPMPEPTPAVQEQGLRTASDWQWFAFPQHDGQQANVDHEAGSLTFDIRVEFEAPHFSPRDLVSLSGVIADGGGIRMRATNLFDGNRLWVEYIDAFSEGHLTRYPAGLLPADTWVNVELAWRADVEPGEPNVELWIDGEWIEPLPGFSEGPKQVGAASPDDVMIFGSWSLGGGNSAEASFDEIEIHGG